MKKFLTGFFILTSLLIPMAAVTEQRVAAGVDAFEVCKIETATGEKPTVCKDVSAQNQAGTNPVIGTLKIVLNVLSFVAGVAAVVLLIINGLRLVLSNGDTNGVKNARSGVIYVLVGLLVVVIAQSIVIFVLDKL